MITVPKLLLLRPAAEQHVGVPLAKARAASSRVFDRHKQNVYVQMTDSVLR
jgi:hypothetical protein